MRTWTQGTGERGHRHPTAEGTGRGWRTWGGPRRGGRGVGGGGEGQQEDQPAPPSSTICSSSSRSNPDERSHPCQTIPQNPGSPQPGPHQPVPGAPAGPHPPFPGDPAPPAPLGPACSLLAPPGDHRTRRAARALETTQSFGAESQVGEDWGHTAGPGRQGAAPLSPWALGSLPFD